nr:hypothetical protein Iba_chr02cCG11490 [Ipomoea batatas]
MVTVERKRPMPIRRSTVMPEARPFTLQKSSWIPPWIPSLQKLELQQLPGAAVIHHAFASPPHRSLQRANRHKHLGDPTGPALQEVGGSFYRSLSSFSRIRFNAMSNQNPESPRHPLTAK